MKKAFIYSLKVGVSTLLLSSILCLATMYGIMRLIMLIKPNNWSFSAHIDFYDIAAITAMSSAILLCATYRISRSAPAFYNIRSRLTFTTLFFAAPLASVYFFVVQNTREYTLTNIVLILLIPFFTSLMLCIKFYRLEHEPATPLSTGNQKQILL